MEGRAKFGVPERLLLERKGAGVRQEEDQGRQK